MASSAGLSNETIKMARNIAVGKHSCSNSKTALKNAGSCPMCKQKEELLSLYVTMSGNQ